MTREGLQSGYKVKKLEIRIKNKRKLIKKYLKQHKKIITLNTELHTLNDKLVIVVSTILNLEFSLKILL